MEIRWKSGIPIAEDVEEKEELKNLIQWGKWQIAKFHTPNKLEIASFYSSQKVQDFQF